MGKKIKKLQKIETAKKKALKQKKLLLISESIQDQKKKKSKEIERRKIKKNVFKKIVSTADGEEETIDEFEEWERENIDASGQLSEKVLAPQRFQEPPVANDKLTRSGGPKAFLERVSKGESPRLQIRKDDHLLEREKHGGFRKQKIKDVYKPATGADLRPNPRREKPRPAVAISEPKYQAKNLIVVEGEVQKNRRGFAFLIREPEDVFISPDYARDIVTGDRVKVWLGKKSNEVIKLEILTRGIKSFIGSYYWQGNQHYVVLKDHTMEEMVFVAPPDKKNQLLSNLKYGHKVMVEILRYQPRLEGTILKDFGPDLSPKFDTLAVVVKHNWPQEFSLAAIETASEASRTIIQSATEKLGQAGARRDLREKNFITIDGKDARDFDDAVYVERTKAGYVLFVAIADVGEFITEGSKLDEEAFARATSVYFPDSVVPMLPEALSNDACSLKPDEDRLTLTCEMHFDLSGKKKNIKVYESIIRSQKRWIYEDADESAKSGDSFWVPFFELYKLLQKNRKYRGSLDFDLPESKVILDGEGNTVDIRRVIRLDAHRLIEEFMIAANESVTEVMEREGWPFVYRIHEQPKSEALMKFMRFAHAVGVNADIGAGDSPKKIAKFLEEIQAHPFAEVLNYLILRSLKQAKYYPQNLGHFGLASEAYTHFTSPIRRYPDLIVHRILKRYVNRKKFIGHELEEFQDYLAKSTEHCSLRERKADTLERTVTKVKKARFIQNHMGEKLAARVTNMSEQGIFVELEKWFVEGLVPVDEVGEDNFEFNEEKLLFYGRRSGRKIRIGDKVEVFVLRCDTDLGLIDFTMRSLGKD